VSNCIVHSSLFSLFCINFAPEYHTHTLGNWYILVILAHNWGTQGLTVCTPWPLGWSTMPSPIMNQYEDDYNIFLLWFQWNYQNISVTIYLVAFYFYTIDPHKGKSQNPYIQLILFFSQVCLFFLVSWMPSMATFLAYLYAAKYAKFGHICIFGYNQIYYKYVHDGYSQKEHNKTSNFVKKSSQLDVWGFSLIM